MRERFIGKGYYYFGVMMVFFGVLHQGIFWVSVYRYIFGYSEVVYAKEYINSFYYILVYLLSIGVNIAGIVLIRKNRDVNRVVAFFVPIVAFIGLLPIHGSFILLNFGLNFLIR